jgi:phosphopantetheinyl transferase
MNSKEVIILLEIIETKPNSKLFETIPSKIKNEILRYQKKIDINTRLHGKLMLVEIAKILNTPWSWEKFQYVKGEKPSNPFFEFSTSYAGNLVCLAGSSNIKVGIDVEVFDEKKDYNFIRDFLNSNEIDFLKSVSHSKIELLKIWTKKEAYLKLVGTGIQEDLTKIDTTNSQNNDCFFTEINHDQNLVISLATFEKCTYKIHEK